MENNKTETKLNKALDYVQYNKFVILIVACTIALLVTLSALYTPDTYIDLWNSIKAFFVNIYNTILAIAGKEVDFYDLEIPSNAPSIFLPPNGSSGSITEQPVIFDIISAKWAIFGDLLISGNHYTLIMKEFLYYALLAFTALIPIVPLIILIFKAINKFYFKTNTKYGKSTVPELLWNKFSDKIFTPFSEKVKEVYYGLKNSKLKLLILIVILLITNVFTFVFALLNMIISNLGILIQTKLDIELGSIFLTNLAYIFYSLRYIPLYLPIVLPVVLIYLNKKRYDIAHYTLECFEAHNEAVLKKRDIVTFKYGPPGTYKTMEMTNDALSLSVMATKKALELKIECHNKFPFFPWLLFEKDIENKIKNRTLKNWAGCKVYVDELQYLVMHEENDFYGYNAEKYGMYHYDGINVKYIFDVLKDYARLHFLYICQGSFIISNYAIREDKLPYSEGNTTRYDYSFFRANQNYNEISYFSRILNFEILRLGMTFNDLAEDKGLEFGVICVTEADKEQVNAVEGQVDSPNSPYPNPKNDGMSRNEKFIRHRATVMGHCFINILKDGQRVMSINADTREIGTVEEMQRPGKEKSTLPLFSVIEKPIYYAFTAFYRRFDEKITYYRGDNTLLHHLFKYINSKLYNWQNVKYNRYSYRKIRRKVSKGTLDGEEEIVVTYLCKWKMLADRYNTATHESYFSELALKANKGVIDYESYTSTTMTDEQFDKQNSYSRKNMSDPQWKERIKEAYKAKLEAEKEEAKAKARAERERRKKENQDYE